MKKKLAVTCLMLLSLFILCACGDGEGKESNAEIEVLDDNTVVVQAAYADLTQVHTYHLEDGEVVSADLYIDGKTAEGLDSAQYMVASANALQVIYDNVEVDDYVLTADYSVKGMNHYKGKTLDELLEKLEELI